MKPISLRNWVREHREELDRAIRLACPNIGNLNDTERAQWVQNDEGLYRRAKSEHVDV